MLLTNSCLSVFFFVTRLLSDHAYSGFYLSVLSGVLHACQTNGGCRLSTGSPENAFRYPRGVHRGTFPSIPKWTTQSVARGGYLWADTSHQSSTNFCVYFFLFSVCQKHTGGKLNGFCLDARNQASLEPVLNPTTQTAAVCRPQVGDALCMVRALIRVRFQWKRTRGVTYIGIRIAYVRSSLSWTNIVFR